MILWAVAAMAGDGVVVNTGFVRRELAGRPVLEMRGGVQSVGLDQPMICLEGAPLGWLALEACGNGSGILHQQAGYDMMHLRAKGAFLHRERARSTLDLFGGLGLTEVQSTTDQPGFLFAGQQPGAVEAAGGEVSLSAKGRFYTTPGTYFVADVNVGAAYIPGANAVFGSGGPVLPFASATLGLGF